MLPTAPPYHRWLVQVLGLVAFHLLSLVAGREDGLWLPGIGLGVALVSWFGWWFVPVLGIDLFLVRLSTHALEQDTWLLAVDSVLLAGQLGLSWWCYAVAAKASRWLDDPRSATVFLLLIPGGITAVAAVLQAQLWSLAGDPRPPWQLSGALGVSRALGLLSVTPALLVFATPFLLQRRIIALPSADRPQRRYIAVQWALGDLVELAGLIIGNLVLALLLVYLQLEHRVTGWTLWGISLLFVVWTGLRQGLSGGLATATVAALGALALAASLGARPVDFRPLQGNLLAQTSTALLVGASAGWVRANEARYRRVVGHIPVILYSVRLSSAIPIPADNERKTGSKPDVRIGSLILQEAEVTLVSQASHQLFGIPPASLEGPFVRWMNNVDPVDREIVLAALTQLVLQKQPVTCEYRVATAEPRHTNNGPPRTVTWVRDTLAPHHGPQGQLDGWDGVIEDITEARALSQDLRRSTGMLQALVANLPAGVYFVHGPQGQALLVNARARQLLGQREDLAAGVQQLVKVFRLHKPDGSEYPSDELPVVKALRWGMTCTANDIVVHRPDGRRVPLITWAAPVDLGNLSRPEAAVWVLEDLTQLQNAELARSESEARLRATFESIAEGILIQDQEGRVLECNPAASAILGLSAADLQGKAWIGPERVCLRGDGTPMPPEERPDRVALQTSRAVRNSVLGLPYQHGVRWLQVNSVPLYVRDSRGASNRQARLVTTFADVSIHRQVQEEMQKAQRLELMGRLASGTVHDFNNMLTALLGMATIARGGLAPEHPVRDDINRIIEIAEQASSVAGQLLAFSKQRRTEPRPVDMNVVVVYTLTILKGVMPPSIRIETRLAPTDLWVLADDTQLKQVMMNLCITARDAMPQGGTLTVSTWRREQEGQAWIVCAIQDTGIGMDEPTRARIFEPFFSTKERGTGLGLAVVLQLVDSFGGRIDVKSEPHHGACFELWLRQCPPPDDWSV